MIFHQQSDEVAVKEGASGIDSSLSSHSRRLKVDPRNVTQGNVTMKIIRNCKNIHRRDIYGLQRESRFVCLSQDDDAINSGS